MNPGRWGPRRKAEGAVVLLTLLCAPLFLTGLGDTVLWGDEGHTLLLGRSVLNHGFPYTGSGADSLSVSRGGEAGVFGLHVQIPWLQAYVEAAAIAILGESPFAARLPFALLGLLCLPLAYVAGKSHARREVTGLVAATLVGLNPFFLLYARQARYYSLAACLVLVILATPAWPSRYRPAAFAAGLVLLAFTFDPAALGVALALAILGASPLRIRLGMADRDYWRGLGIGAGALGAWLLLASTANRARLPDPVASLTKGLPFHFAYVNAHVMPGLVVLALGALWWFHARQPSRQRQAVQEQALACFMVVGAIIVLCATLPPDRFARYGVAAAPALSVALAMLIVEATRPLRRAVLAQVIVVGFLTLTNIPFAASHAVASTMNTLARGVVSHPPEPLATPLLNLMGELRKPPSGPLRGVINYMRTRADSETTFVATYGDLALRAQTPMRVYGFWSGLPADETEWDWIWIRSVREGPLDNRVEFRQRLRTGRYRTHVLPVRDWRWENRPDPHLHVYENPGPEAPPVVLWERVR